MILAALLLQAAAPADPCAWGTPSAPRRMTGIYVNEFEAQRFYQDLGVAEITRSTPFALLNRDEARQHALVGPWLPGHIFRIEFIGVERAAPTGSSNSHGPCPPISGETSTIEAIDILAQVDLGLASDNLPMRQR